MVCCNALFGAEAEERLHWEEVLLEEEKGVSETLQQRQAVQVWQSRVTCCLRHAHSNQSFSPTATSLSSVVSWITTVQSLVSCTCRLILPLALEICFTPLQASYPPGCPPCFLSHQQLCQCER
jgi:hypothetical protein